MSDSEHPQGDIGAMRASVNDAAGACAALWIPFLLFQFYLATSVGSVTHVDLFLERAVKVPLTSLELPLPAFFILTPALLLLLHAYVLTLFAILAERAKRLRELLDTAENGDDQRRQLSSSAFLQFLAGPSDLRAGAFGWALGAIAWVSLALGPVGLLLLIQVQFLPYQNETVTWLHRLALLVDLALLAWLWRQVLACQPRPARPRLARALAWTGRAAMALTVVFSVFVAAHAEGPPPAWAFWRAVFRSPVNPITGRPALPFSDRLVLTDLNMADLAGKSPDVFRARGRNLRGAIFDHAALKQVDFDGADLEDASFRDSQLDEAKFDGARLERADFGNATARGASFEAARLGQADFHGADLAGADFAHADLRKARLDSAGLRGAKLPDADLSEASLVQAFVFAANFEGARLQRADFTLAQISATDFSDAAMDGARLTNTTLAATDFSRARLIDVSGAGANAEHLSLAGMEGDDARAGRELKQKFGAACVEPEQLQAAQAELFAQRLCLGDADNAYVTRSAVFQRLRGEGAVSMIDQLLSADCPTSEALAVEDHVRLRSQRARLTQAATAPASHACAVKGEAVAATKP